MTNETKWTDVPEFAEVIDQYLDLYKKALLMITLPQQLMMILFLR